MIDTSKILFLTKQSCIYKEGDKQEIKGNMSKFHRMINMGNCQSNIWVMKNIH